MRNYILLLFLFISNALLGQLQQKEIQTNVVISNESHSVFESSKYFTGVFQLGFSSIYDTNIGFELEIKNIEDQRYTLKLNERTIIDYNYFSCMLPEGIYHITLTSLKPLTVNINKFIHFIEDDSRSICGTDDRSLSNSARCGRVMPTGCTAQLLSNGLLSMSGHCLYQSGTGNYNFSVNSFVEFNVPLSSSTGATTPSLPQDQYPISIASITHEYPFPNTCGQDWCIFQVNQNANGLTPFQVQNNFYYVTTGSPTVSFDIRITGYGINSTNQTWNQVQQSHSDTNNGVETLPSGGVIISYDADTTPGNSGSAIQREGNIGFSYGIHNSGGCGGNGCSGNGDNSGISFQYDNLEDAINDYYGNNTIHVSKVSNSSTENGTAFRPYDTLVEGQTNSTSNSTNTVILMTGTYNETNGFMLDKPMLIKSPAGQSVIK